MEIVSNDKPHTTREDRATRKDKATFPTILHPIEIPSFPSSPAIQSMINIVWQCCKSKREEPKRRKGWRREEGEGDMVSTGEGVKRRSGFGYKDEIGLGLLGGARF